jgi:hypothetical protein
MNAQGLGFIVLFLGVVFLSQGYSAASFACFGLGGFMAVFGGRGRTKA